MKQFEVATKTNRWTLKEKAIILTVSLRGEAINVQQILPQEGIGDYNELVKRLEMRYMHVHLEQVCQSQMKNRRQNAGENLCGRYGWLGTFSLPYYTPKRFRVFGSANVVKMQRALLFAHLKTLMTALAIALKFKVAKEAYQK